MVLYAHERDLWQNRTIDNDRQIPHMSKSVPTLYTTHTCANKHTLDFAYCVCIIQFVV